MIAFCVDCKFFFDDTFRWTFCPHSTFPANDGNNNFKVHHDSYLSERPPIHIPIAVYEQSLPSRNG